MTIIVTGGAGFIGSISFFISWNIIRRIASCAWIS